MAGLKNPIGDPQKGKNVVYRFNLTMFFILILIHREESFKSDDDENSSYGQNVSLHSGSVFVSAHLYFE